MQWSRNTVHSHFTLCLRAHDYIKRLPPTPMVRPLDESQGSSPLRGHGSWLTCEVALRDKLKIDHKKGKEEEKEDPNRILTNFKGGLVRKQQATLLEPLICKWRKTIRRSKLWPMHFTWATYTRDGNWGEGHLSPLWGFAVPFPHPTPWKFLKIKNKKEGFVVSVAWYS